MDKKGRHAERARLARQKKDARRQRSKTEPRKPSSDALVAQPNQRWRRSFGWLGRTVLAAMTIIGGASVLYEFRPKIRVAEGHSFDERDAYATQFLITNESSLFDLRDVEATCGLNGPKRGKDLVLAIYKFPPVGPANRENRHNPTRRSRQRLPVP
jgi:hypothetical protein